MPNVTTSNFMPKWYIEPHFKIKKKKKLIFSMFQKNQFKKHTMTLLLTDVVNAFMINEGNLTPNINKDIKRQLKELI